MALPIMQRLMSPVISKHSCHAKKKNDWRLQTSLSHRFSLEPQVKDVGVEGHEDGPPVNGEAGVDQPKHRVHPRLELELCFSIPFIPNTNTILIFTITISWNSLKLPWSVFHRRIWKERCYWGRLQLDRGGTGGTKGQILGEFLI